MLVANILCRIQCDDDLVLFKACIDSIFPVCDRILILSTDGNADGLWNLLPSCSASKVEIDQVETGFIEDQGFAAARNLLLANVNDGDHVLYVDADECHFPEQLQLLKDQILPITDDIGAHFIHFTLGSNAFEKFEARTIIVRKTKGTRWEGKVHEKLVHDDPNRYLFHSDYHYAHFGYVRDQSLIANHWKQYTALEGDDPNRIDQEYPDHQCLSHRLDSLLPFFGEYPSSIPPEWVWLKRIQL